MFNKVFTCLLLAFAVSCAAGVTAQKPDQVDEILTPPGAKRIGLSNWDFTLESTDSLDNLTSFYIRALKSLNAYGFTESNHPQFSELKIKWQWEGGYNNNRRLSITIYDSPGDKYTILIKRGVMAE